MPYIPKAHEKYNMLPICQKYNVEIFVWDNKLFKKIQSLTNLNDHMLCPYQRYKSYDEFLENMNNLINRFPNLKREIIEYRKSVMKMNNKDEWGIVQYIGKSNYEFTNGKYYYVPMYTENGLWTIIGIIDNEEYTAFEVWSTKCTNPVNLTENFKIIIDPSNGLKETFIKLMKHQLPPKII